jgi:hypothetical protein
LAKKDEWIIPSDEELDALMRELMAPVYDELEPPSAYHDLGLAQVEPIEEETDIPTEAIAFLPPADLNFVWSEPDSQTPQKSRVNTKAILSAGVAALGVASGAYTLSRPCVVGSCPELSTAQGLSQESTQTVQSAKDAQDLASARQTLNQAIATLETIPMWSGRSQDAQQLIQTYESQGRNLDNLIAVEAIATAATEKTQAPLYSLDDWRSLHSLWKTAVNQLKKVSPESEFYDYAQAKLRDYQAVLTETEYRLQQEEAAQTSLDLAKQSIQLAEARRQIAQSVENWQLVQANWEVVVERLQAIPPGTLASVEAQRLLTAYQPELVQTRDRLQNEQSAANLFEQAKERAQIAQTAAQQSDWQMATSLWQQANAYAAQVPASSIYRNQADALMNSYQKAITQSQPTTQGASQQVSADLTTVCNHQLHACDLVAVNGAIQVRLSSVYVQAIAAARTSGNANLQNTFYQHQLLLKQNLESLATKYHLPVEVYDPSNALLARHLPQSSTTQTR